MRNVLFIVLLKVCSQNECVDLETAYRNTNCSAKCQGNAVSMRRQQEHKYNVLCFCDASENVGQNKLNLRLARIRPGNRDCHWFGWSIGGVGGAKVFSYDNHFIKSHYLLKRK